MRHIQKSKNFSISLLSAGSYYIDAGASLGVFPKSIWHKDLQDDEQFCLPMSLNCLLIQTPQLNILIDTGVGNILTDKQKKIYRPSQFTLLEELSSLGIKREHIHHVILTHLHFDHLGGILHESFPNELTFPNAYHHIQKQEWFSATNPDELNAPAYPFQQHLSLLSDSFKLNLPDGNTELIPGITLQLVKGHSEGMQIVQVEDEELFLIFASDIIPSRYHLNLSVISAYDLCRKTTFNVKKRVINELKAKKGILVFGHADKEPCYQF